MSSTAIPGPNRGDLSITFSYGGFDVSQSTEYVYFDWLSLLGVLGGACSLAMAAHLLSMILFDRVILRLYRWIAGKKEYDLLSAEEGNINAKKKITSTRLEAIESV